MNLNRKTNPLKKQRMEKGLTQKYMSEKLGITQSQYSNIENGETDPTKYLRPISEIFGCKPNEVLSGQILKDMEKDLKSKKVSEASWAGALHLRARIEQIRKQLLEQLLFRYP